MRRAVGRQRSGKTVMKYDNPFPGMNPYLERRHIWPDFHDGLIG